MCDFEGRMTLAASKARLVRHRAELLGKLNTDPVKQDEIGKPLIMLPKGLEHEPQESAPAIKVPGTLGGSGDIPKYNSEYSGIRNTSGSPVPSSFDKPKRYVPECPCKSCSDARALKKDTM